MRIQILLGTAFTAVLLSSTLVRAQASPKFLTLRKPECLIVMDARDAICVEHIVSVLNKHHIRQGPSFTSIVLYVRVLATRSVVEHILAKEAPHSTYSYSLQNRGGLPTIIRHWIRLNAHSQLRSRLFADAPSIIRGWLMSQQAETGGLERVDYAAVKYLDHGLSSIGYIVKGLTTDRLGAKNSFERQFLAGHSEPYERGPFVRMSLGKGE